MTLSEWKAVSFAFLAFTIVPTRLLVPTAVFAQNSSSSPAPESEILVRVTDPAGAVIPGVEVTFQSSRAIKTKTETNEIGETSVRLPSGQYVVTASRFGFTTTKVIDFRVTAPASTTLNIPLRVGGHTFIDEVPIEIPLERFELPDTLLPLAPAIAAAPKCKGNPKSIGICYSIHGRLTLGADTVRLYLWPVGAKRMLGVTAGPRLDDADDPIRPPNLKLSPDIEAIYGDFEVCPFTPERKGEMQLVCIETASHVVAKHYPHTK